MSLIGAGFRALLVLVLLVKTTVAEMPAAVIATIEAVTSYLFYPLAICAQVYRLAAAWLAFWRDMTVCSILVAYSVIAMSGQAYYGFWKTTVAEMPAAVMATIEAVTSYLFYPLAICAQVYRLTAAWLAFWRDMTVCSILMAYSVIASFILAPWRAVVAAFYCAAAVLDFLSNFRGKANSVWLYIRNTSSSQGIRVCTLFVNKGAAYKDRHSEERIMKALQRIYDFIAAGINSRFLKNRGWTLPASPTARKTAERQCLQVKVNQVTQAAKAVKLAGSCEDFVKSCGGSNSAKFCAWKDAVLQHPEQYLQPNCSTSTGNSRPYAALKPEALERIAATIRAMQPMAPSSAELEDWQEMALILQQSFNTFATEQDGEQNPQQPAHAAHFNSIAAGPAGIRAS